MAEELTNWRYVESFGSGPADPHKWFRIMPVGKFRRFGRFVEVTNDKIQEMVMNFRVVPPTDLPVNVEHADTGGRVGVIANLRAVTNDGLYAIIDWTPEGLDHLANNRFGYYSPEIVWGPVDYEGRMVRNMLFGLALTNSPYFGTDTALFSMQDLSTAGDGTDPDHPIDQTLSVQGETQMATQMDEKAVAGGIRQFFVDIFSQTPPAAAAEPSTPAPAAEDLTAVRAENEELKARLAAVEAAEQQARRDARVAQFKAQLPKLPEVAEKLALIEDGEMADYLAQQFAALGNQVDEGALLGEQGSAGGHAEDRTPADEFAALVEARKAEGMKPAEALRSVAAEHPKLYRAYTRESGSRKANDADD